MELDSRKNEAKDELKREDITIEVGASVLDMISSRTIIVGTA